MRKENGRLTKEDTAKLDKIFGKRFRCNACGEHLSRKSVEFGEEITCPHCGGIMEEDI